MRCGCCHQARGEVIPELRGPSPACRSLSALWETGEQGVRVVRGPTPFASFYQPTPPALRLWLALVQNGGGDITPWNPFSVRLQGGCPLDILWPQPPLRDPLATLAHLELAHEFCKNAEEGLGGGSFGILPKEGQCLAQFLHGLSLQPIQCPKCRLGSLQEGLRGLH